MVKRTRPRSAAVDVDHSTTLKANSLRSPRSWHGNESVATSMPRGDTGTAVRRRYVFVTVGTTRFDALVVAVASPAFAAAVLKCGLRRIIVQAGSSDLDIFAPFLDAAALSQSIVRGGSSEFPLLCHAHGVDYEVYRLKPSIAADVGEATIVVSHAGAGSIFETLRSRPGTPLPLVAVPNSGLAENHQEELAGALARMNALVASTVKGLPAALAQALSTPATALPRIDRGALVAAIDDAVGF